MVFILALVYMEETLPNTRKTAFQLSNFTSSYLYLFRNTTFMLVASAQAVIVGVTWIWLAGIRILYIDVLGMSANVYGYYNAVTILAYLIGSVINYYLIKRYNQIKVLYIGFAILVFCLILMIAISPLIGKNPLMIQVVNSLASASVALILPNSTSFAIIQLKEHKGNGSAFLGTLQMVLAAIAAFLIGWINPNSVVQICLPMLLSALLSWVLLIFATRKVKKMLV